ncbi:MAG: hypothetical protein HY695_15335 [Deltaproteobacteria bacterium]|nr:hypothetical protein [Deltaproteobacteria bacterium]
MVTSETPESGQQAPEQKIETLAEEIGRLIRNAEPERREDLKELAFTLIREEAFQGATEDARRGGTTPGPFNPLGSGVLIFVLGGGLSFVFGPVGLVLMFGGLIFMLWGLLMSWLKR